MEDNPILITIETLKAKITTLSKDVQRLKRTVNEFCADAGIAPAYSITPDVEGGEMSSLRSDIFYGQTISGAAKIYLEMRKASGRGAASINEIYAALKDGGYKFEAKDDENAKNGLRISLRKNSQTFHRLPNGEYGLLTWYPGAKAPKPEKEEEEPPPPPPKKKGPKVTTGDPPPPPRRRPPPPVKLPPDDDFDPTKDL